MLYEMRSIKNKPFKASVIAVLGNIKAVKKGEVQYTTIRKTQVLRIVIAFFLSFCYNIAVLSILNYIGQTKNL